MIGIQRLIVLCRYNLIGSHDEPNNVARLLTPTSRLVRSPTCYTSKSSLSKIEKCKVDLTSRPIAMEFPPLPRNYSRIRTLL
ncbi:hypothetical protein VFPPC_15640 [Pochonia chlamydosporia 170]|uniref:Uncharacterized protein n=1 Tax=Pochonia chlamydosporia 170 TaxID=1380566 RepID=A0A179FZB9_METCM|nr:hypothetical protein VFPPC_15640 [Pochonia chlamydosporia 170]OAQ70994.1 hypothetical protein VFPPC_15640 [Pochonia chlamydosporia 170]